MDSDPTEEIHLNHQKRQRNVPSTLLETDTLQGVEEKLRLARIELDTLKAAAQEQKTQIESVRKELKQQLKQKQERKREIATSIQKIKQQLAQQDLRKAQLQTRRKITRGEKDTYIKKLESQLAILKEERKRGQINKFRAELSTLEDEKKIKKKYLDDLERRIEELKLEGWKLDTNNQELYDKNTSLSLRTKYSEQQLNKLDTLKKNMESSLHPIPEHKESGEADMMYSCYQPPHYFDGPQPQPNNLTLLDESNSSMSSSQGDQDIPR